MKSASSIAQASPFCFLLLLALLSCSKVHVHGALTSGSTSFQISVGAGRAATRIRTSRVSEVRRNSLQLLKQTPNSNLHPDIEKDGIFRANIQHHHLQRRSFLSKIATSSTAIILTSSAQTANAAIPFLNSDSDRRQLELCLVTILRTQYWAKSVSKALKARLLTPPEEQDELLAQLGDTQKKQPYLEARLGAKALLTKKIGGGANSNVIKLASFQLKDCLEDGRYWCGVLAKTGQLVDYSSSSSQQQSANKSQKIICNQKLSSSTDDLIESLASLVEFDGLETTIDPSPRSSLMLGMYTNAKGVFVYRTLTERVIPSCEDYLGVFGRERRDVCEEFVRRNYGEEVLL